MLSSQLVGGRTMKDGTVTGGATLQWVLGNDGTLPWPKATTLRLVAGPVLASHSVEVPPVVPGQTAVIELEVSAVEVPAEVSYVLVTPRGEAFGEILTVEVTPESTVADATPKPLVGVLSSPTQITKASPSSMCRVEWTLANVGTVEWPSDACACLIYSSMESKHLPLEVPLPDTAPGQLLHLEVCGLMPSEVGTFKAIWAITSGTHPDFGELLLAEFEVEGSLSESELEEATEAAGQHCALASELRYSVKVFNKYAALAQELEPEDTQGQVLGFLGPAPGGASSRSPAPPSIKSRETTHCGARTGWSRGRSPCYKVMSLFLALLLGPHVCFGSSTQRGVVGTCSGGVECTAWLEASETRIVVEGAVATVELVQTFQGGMTDASFVLPLHEAAVVTNFSVDIGGRLLRGSIQERKQAQRTYNEHVQAGCPAALAQQGASKAQNPEDARDLFRISIGNVPANTLAQVNLSLVQELAVEDAGSATTAVRLLVPTAAPSRFGWLAGAAEAELALLASSRQLPKSFAIHAEVHGEVQRITSPSHAGLVSMDWTEGEPRAAVSLVLAGVNVTEAACKVDFVLRLVLGPKAEDGESLLAPRLVLEEHPEFQTWVGMVELVPRFTFAPEAAVELLFLIDRSGSMGSFGKVSAASRALQHFVRSLPVGALLNIVGFGSRFEALFADGPRELNETSFQEALAYAEQLQANFGGTELREALTWLLTQPGQEGRARRVFVLTDGEVWDQARTLSAVEQHCGVADCQLNALGIGSGASTALVQGLARAGRGSARFVAHGEEGQLEEEVVQMLAVALQPVFSNVSVNWPSAVRHEGAVPLLSRRRLQARESAPEPHVAGPAPMRVEKDTNFAGNGLFDETADQPAAALLSQSIGAASAAEERRHAQDLERFVKQGGVLEGPLQAPQPAPPILVGQRWAAYAFLGRLRGGDLPSSLVLRAHRSGRPVEVHAPVARRTSGRTLHSLAARRLVETLEGHGERVKGVLPGEEDRRWQVAALGVAYGIATAQTSWLALGEKLEVEPDASVGATSSLDAASHKGSLSLTGRVRLGSSPSVYGMARLGSNLAVLDFCHLGSALALRSFCRLGSSLSVYGMSRLGASLAVLDCSCLGSSMSLRSFARMGSSLSTIGLASQSAKGGEASPSEAAKEQEPTPRPVQPRLLAFVGLEPSSGPFLPLLPIWSKPASGSCVAAETNLSSWGRGLLPAGEARLGLVTIKGSALLPGGAILTQTSSATAAAVVAAERLAVSTECEFTADGNAVAHLNLTALSQADEPSSLPLVAGGLAEWRSKCPAAAYEPLVAAQRFDGSFAWPEAFLRSLGWVNATAEEVLPPKTLSEVPWLASSLAVSALRRCFEAQRHKWELIERKALARLSVLAPAGTEAAIALAERLVLVRALAVANAKFV